MCSLSLPSNLVPQPWTRVLPTSAWMNPGGTQSTTSTRRPVCPCATATSLENGIASRAWQVMPCPPSASLRITVEPTLPSGSTAATPSPRMVLSPCQYVPASVTTAASGTPVSMWRPALGGTSSTACPDPQSASMFTAAVSEHSMHPVTASWYSYIHCVNMHSCVLHRFLWHLWWGGLCKSQMSWVGMSLCAWNCPGTRQTNMPG